MRILCATDLSSRSDRALRRAALLARQAAAELVMLSVVDDDQPRLLVETERREVAALLASQASGVPELQGLQPRLRVEAGDAFDTIIHVAEAEQADLIVMGEHRKRLLRDMVVGTTIERVMRLGHRPVLMVNRSAERPYRRLLAAVDMSERSADALRTALRLGLATGAEWTVFHAFHQPGRGSMMLADLPAAAVEGHVATTAAETHAALTRFLGGIDPGFASRPPKIVLEEGTPADTLEAAVRRLSPDLVVMGTRGHGLVGRLILGSVAETALRTLACDVLAVPPPAP